jgi:diaminopimelate dehydrogenase
MIAKKFSTVDCFDTHAKLYDYFKHINKINKKSNTVSVIAVGWDPGLFSLARLMFESVLPAGNTHTFWGSGVSQGHSEAIRSLGGIKYAVAYTHPKIETMDKVREGENPKLKPRDKHTRECFVVLENDTPEKRKEIDKKIKTMPNYFVDYDTTVNYITEEEFKANHSKMPHGGVTLCAQSQEDSKQLAELSLKLDSNPDFTASVMLAYARAVYKLAKDKSYGAFTILDIPISYISNKKETDIIKKVL